MNSVRIPNRERPLSVCHKESIIILHFSRMIPIFKLLIVGNMAVKHDKEDHPMSVNDA